MSVEDKASVHAATWKASNTNAIPVHEHWECTLRQLGSKLKRNEREGVQFLSYRPDFYFQAEERVEGCERNVISHKVVTPELRFSEAQEVPAGKSKLTVLYPFWTRSFDLETSCLWMGLR